MRMHLRRRMPLEHRLYDRKVVLVTYILALKGR